ncbi:hypothetical protein [Ornithinibacillus sp. 179-J 7C1 HS]|uniref:hypothetical protein n=1 Tax=Ornithinibacillus sp. 179-J 7C1 HS TaxID=3142384 RepID=UPI0039A1476C
MAKPELKVWRPKNQILKGRIYEHNITLASNGLMISLLDEVNTKIEIVYDGSSQIIGDYVWAYRYSNEILQSSSLVDLMLEAQKKSKMISNNNLEFYKMINSDFIDFVKKSGFADDSINLEHHLYPVADGVLEIISDYEPSIIIKESSHQE